MVLLLGVDGGCEVSMGPLRVSHSDHQNEDLTHGLGVSKADGRFGNLRATFTDGGTPWASQHTKAGSDMA
jgi:hypothetical protein